MHSVQLIRLQNNIDPLHITQLRIIPKTIFTLKIRATIFPKCEIRRYAKF